MNQGILTLKDASFLPGTPRKFGMIQKRGGNYASFEYRAAF
jgi:hypothetical protein